MGVAMVVVILLPLLIFEKKKVYITEGVPPETLLSRRPRKLSSVPYSDGSAYGIRKKDKEQQEEKAAIEAVTVPYISTTNVVVIVYPDIVCHGMRIMAVPYTVAYQAVDTKLSARGELHELTAFATWNLHAADRRRNQSPIAADSVASIASLPIQPHDAKRRCHKARYKPHTRETSQEPNTVVATVKMLND